MAFYSKTDKVVTPVEKRTSIGDGRRKRGSFARKGKKAYRGQGKRWWHYLKEIQLLTGGNVTLDSSIIKKGLQLKLNPISLT